MKLIERVSGPLSRSRNIVREAAVGVNRSLRLNRFTNSRLMVELTLRQCRGGGDSVKTHLLATVGGGAVSLNNRVNQLSAKNVIDGVIRNRS